MPSHDDLRTLWLQAPEGKLCGREQAKAWVLREVWRTDGRSEYGMLSFIAGKVMKMKKGKPNCLSPGLAAVREFFNKIDNDPEWFPGKTSETKRGPKRALIFPNAWPEIKHTQAHLIIKHANTPLPSMNKFMTTLAYLFFFMILWQQPGSNIFRELVLELLSGVCSYIRVYMAPKRKTSARAKQRAKQTVRKLANS